ncbi:MAG TPA: DUF4350 domain-containing protein [Dehalococcoidia bacterium]|nr:DUF4350 domain-containing protein [Dehalococcoidia bacterium]
MPLGRFFGLLFLGTAGIIMLTVWFFPTNIHFETQNPSWNGLKDFEEEFHATSLETLDALPQNAEGSVLLVIPYLEPTEADVAQLRVYLERGGVLILADDYGYGNTVLEGLGVSARFSGALLLDSLFNYRTAYFPLATNLEPSPLTTEVSSLALNYASALEGEGLSVVARSSPFSYLDLNNDGERNTSEPVGPFPVVGQIMVGKGHLILLADPSIFINTMLAAEDNRQFVQNLLGSVGPDPHIFIDQVHTPSSRLEQAKAALAAVRQLAAQPAMLAAFTLVLTFTLLGPWRRRKGVLA